MTVICVPTYITDSTVSGANNNKTGLTPVVLAGYAMTTSAPAISGGNYPSVKEGGNGLYYFFYDPEANGEAAFQVDAGSALSTPSDRYFAVIFTRDSSRILGGINNTGQVSVGGYAAGQDPASLLLVTPANKLATDGSNRVTVGTNADKAGYSLTTGEHAAISGTDVPSALTAQGYTSARAAYLDTLNGLVANIWAAATSTLTSAGSIGLKLAGWALGTDNKVLLSANAQAGVTIPAVTSIGNPVTVGGYASGEDPASLLLATPSNRLATDSSGRVTANAALLGGQPVTASAPVTILASVGTAATSAAQSGDLFGVVNPMISNHVYTAQALAAAPTGGGGAVNVTEIAGVAVTGPGSGAIAFGNAVSSYAGADTPGTTTLLSKIGVPAGGSVSADIAALASGNGLFLPGTITTATGAGAFVVQFAGSAPPASGLVGLFCCNTSAAHAPEKQQIATATAVDSTHLTLTFATPFGAAPSTGDTVLVG